jgi:hypothetical protein
MCPGSGYTVLLPYLLPSWHVRGTRMCEASHTRCEIHARACIGIASSYSVWFFFASSCRSAPVSEDDLSENRYLLFGLMVDRGRMSGASRRLAAPTTCRAPSPTQNPLQSDAFELADQGDVLDLLPEFAAAANGNGFRERTVACRFERAPAASSTFARTPA